MFRTALSEDADVLDSLLQDACGVQTGHHQVIIENPNPIKLGRRYLWEATCRLCCIRLHITIEDLSETICVNRKGAVHTWDLRGLLPMEMQGDRTIIHRRRGRVLNEVICSYCDVKLNLIMREYYNLLGCPKTSEALLHYLHIRRDERMPDKFFAALKDG